MERKIVMQEIIDTLIDRLYSKDVLPLEVPRLIRDVIYIINEENLSSVEPINRRLRTLGWKEQVMDEYVLQLILYLMENEGKHPIEPATLH